jgi:integrase
MAQVNQRLWKIPGQRTKRRAWGFTAQINGKQVRRYKAEWTQDDAEAELAKALLQIEREKPQASITFSDAVERYLAAKWKKSVAFDKLYLHQLRAAFGAETPLEQITAARISAWKAAKLSAINPRTKLPYAPASINRPLAALRHLLQLACDEWEVLSAVPKIRLEKEPQARVRWLEPHEEVRLLEACRASRTKRLADIVTVALETGLRRGELLGLAWDRVDLSRGVIRLETTKSGRRREVPMRQAVYNVLAALPAPHHGRVWPYRSIRNAFEAAVETAGLDNFRFHDIRHHFASWFMMRGGNLQALKELLGHSDIKTTLIYAHLSPAHLRSEVAKTERAVELTSISAQGSAQEIAELEGVSPK